MHTGKAPNDVYKADAVVARKLVEHVEEAAT